MNSNNSNIILKINEKTFVKNPETSDLGRKIVSGSIDLIDSIGFEAFTFKKLAQEIQSTEASIYRYFESKHHLLVYIASWYWGWIEYRLILKMANIDSPEDRLMRAVTILTERIKIDSDFSHINEIKLGRIIISESSKIYLCKSVKEDNKFGFFVPYKRVVELVSEIILEITPSYKYPHMLVSTLVEGAHYQRYFAEHLPRLTDVIEGEDAVVTFYKEMVFKLIKP